MRDLDELNEQVRAALHSPPGYTPHALDLQGVMVAGGRLKRRRRLAVAGATAVALVAIAAGSVVGLGHLGPAPRPADTATALPSLPAPVDGRIGAVISTGLTAAVGKQWVLSFVPFTWPGDNGVSFGLSISQRDADGAIEPSGLTVNEYEGSDRAAGFHPMQGPMTLDGGVIQPAFGYYVGKPAKITAVIAGHTVAAHQATWSADPNVTAYWFDPAEGRLSELGAFDSSGNRLPDGHIEIEIN